MNDMCPECGADYQVDLALDHVDLMIAHGEAVMLDDTPCTLRCTRCDWTHSGRLHNATVRIGDGVIIGGDFRDG